MNLPGVSGELVEPFLLEWGEVVDRAVDAFGVEPEHPVRRCFFELIDVSPGPLVMGSPERLATLSRRLLQNTISMQSSTKGVLILVAARQPRTQRE